MYTPLALPNALALVASAGVACHLLVFRRIEPTHPLAHLFLLVIIPGLMSAFLWEYFSCVTLAVALAFTTYTLATLTSLAVYRLSPAHPLARYPGPLPAKLTKLWFTWKVMQGRQHIVYQRLHEQYGDIVRIGPNELSLRDSGAVGPLLGSTGVPKGQYWNGRMADQQGAKALIAVRDAKEHCRRRRPWNRAFGTAALKNYEPAIQRRAAMLVEQLGAQVGEVDLSKWVSFFAYDFMSDMAFGGGSEMLVHGDEHGLWSLLEKGQPAALLLGHLPWVRKYYSQIPGVGRSLKTFRAYCKEQAITRYTHGSKQKDLFYHLMDEEGHEPHPPPVQEVASDGVLAIVAGSDTTATALGVIFFLLLRSPTAYTRLRAEIDTLEERALDLAEQARMHYLNAVINEALRLFPPVASGTQRGTTNETGGKIVGSYWIPAGTSVCMHFYSLARDARNFSPFPDSFIPERWLSADTRDALEPSVFKCDGAVVHNTAAFLPFSSGPAICVGKNLAYQEMRAVVCFVLRHFEMRFADGFEPEAWVDGLKDYFVVQKGKLPVLLTPRS